MNSHWKVWTLCLFGILLVASPVVNGEGHESGDDDDDYADDQTDGDGIPPIITTLSKTLNVKEGESFELECKGEHFDNYGVIWSHGAKLLTAGDTKLTNERRIHLFENNSLVIENAMRDDTGVYTCTLWVNITVQHVVFVISDGTVPGMPHVLVPAKVLIVNQSEPVSLTCHSTGSPTPSVSWIRQGKKAFPSGEKRIEGSVVTFPSVSRHHAGNYDCVAINSLGTATTALQLEVNYIPEIEIDRDSVHSKNEAEVELICRVHAEPKPKSVTWYFNDVAIDPKSKKHGNMEKVHHEYTLHIKNVSEKDFGNYKCVAENKLGQKSGEIQLTGTPSQPVLTEGTSGSEHMSYRLVWKIESSIPIDDYKLSYRMGNDEFQDISVKGEQNPQQQFVYIVTHTLTKLTSNSENEVKLLARNKNGWSLPSRVHKFHINGKNYQSLDYQAETAKASVVSGGQGSGGGSRSALVSSSLFAWFLVPFIMSFWRWQ